MGSGMAAGEKAERGAEAWRVAPIPWADERPGEGHGDLCHCHAVMDPAVGLLGRKV